MSEDIRKMINKVKNFKDFVNENIDLSNIIHEPDFYMMKSCKDNSCVYLTKDEKIKKVFKNINDYDFKLTKEFFPTHPEVFPIIYDITDNIITMENLDTNKAKIEYNKLNNFFKKNYKKTAYNFLYKDHSSIGSGNLEKPLHVPDEIPKDINDLFVKFRTLIYKIDKIVGNKNSLLDVHADNFGYDKNGNLKMIDI